MTKSINLKKILIAVEDSLYSEKAAVFGFSLAKKLDAQVALIHCYDLPVAIPYAGADPLLNDPQMMVPEMMNIQEGAGESLLKKFTDKYGNDIKITAYNRLGIPKDEILASAEEWGADLIILGTHGRTGFDHFISGSVAEDVMRKAKCAVLIVPKDEE